MDGWDSEDPKEIVVGDRTMRVGRRRTERRPFTVSISVGGRDPGRGSRRRRLLLVHPAHRPRRHPPNPAIVAPGGFRATVGADNTITVGLEIRNTADVT